MECQRLGNRRAGARRMRADLLELPDISDLLLGDGLQRPQLGNVLAADVQESCPVRREQPLVQARAVEIGLEVAQLEREMRDRVRAVDDRQEAALPRQATELLHPEAPSRQVRDV